MSAEWIDPGLEKDNIETGLQYFESGYLLRLKAVLNVLDVGSPSDLVRSHVQNVPPAPITGVWTAPRVRTVPSIRADKEWLRQQGVELRFDAVFHTLEERRRVLIGGPGAGKTTAAKFVAINFAEQRLGHKTQYIPVYAPIRLVDLRASNSVEAVLSCACSLLGNSQDANALSEALKTYKLKPYFILDGIDDRARGKGKEPSIAEIVEKLNNAYPEACLFLTSRTFEYLYDSSCQIASASHYLLSEFMPRQVETTIRSWHNTAATIAGNLGLPSGGYSARAEALIDFLKGSKPLQELTQTPLLLNLVQVLFDPEQSLPQTIPSICIQAIKYLFIERPRSRKARPGQDETDQSTDSLTMRPDFEALCWEVLEDLAGRSYERSDRSGIRLLTWSELRDSVERAIGADTPPGFLEKGHLVYPMLSHVVEGHGVLTDINKETFTFVHNLFQDVLAGKYFGKLENTERRMLASKSVWHSAISAWANLAAAKRNERAEAILFGDELFREWGSKPQELIKLLAAASIAVELRQRTIGLSEGLIDDLCGRIRDALQEILWSAELNVGLRVQIGDLLGGLGDPRVPGELNDVAQIERWFVSLPAGRFHIGRTTPHSYSNPKYGEVPCCPVLTADFSKMLIGRFPVTNAEYGLFMEEDGYENKSFWRSDEALAWVRGDERFIAELHGLVVGSALKHFETELRAGRVSKEDLTSLIEGMLRRREPLHWRDVRFNRPNQPVVGVNWWEARAYCAWLESRILTERPDLGSLRADLPTEFEWERAGRPTDDQRQYPWGGGNENNWGFIRIDTQSIARTGAVGLFPFAGWEQGPLDLIGNTWDWTRSQKRQYKDIVDVQSEDITGLTERIVRGGSWLSGEKESASLTFRSFDPPCNAYEDLGFRVGIYFAK